MSTNIDFIMREALKNADTGSSFITKAMTPSTTLETITFSTTRGTGVLCGIGFGISIVMTGGVQITSPRTKYEAEIIDDIFLKVDNQLRVRSSEMGPLLMWSNDVLQRFQDDVFSATVPRANFIVPVSGAGGRVAQLDIDLAPLSAISSAGSWTSGILVITPFYTNVPMPIFSVVTGNTPATGTGAYKVQVSGDFLGNGFIDQVILLGDGTIVIDDVRIIQEDGKILVNNKFTQLGYYWQNIHLNTVTTVSSVIREVGVNVSSSVAWSINSSIELDVTTSGTVAWLVAFKNSPTDTSIGVSTGIPTPAPESRSQPRPNMPSGPDSRTSNVIMPGDGGGRPIGQAVGGGVRKLFGLK